MSVFFNALTVDPSSLDAELEDAGTVGPELAFIAKEQRLLARAFCWRDANSDWPLLLVQIPGTEALWTLQHPVFTPIIRRWGMALRVIGISREAMAFDSVEYIMREVEWGWLIRYLHSTGASFFFIVVYLHMFRGLMYGSYRKPRELIWIFGMLIYPCLMAEAFFGYLLPWGQMSYWGAQVIVNLFGSVPLIGEGLAEWIRGDYVISDATLNRFFAFHVIRSE